MNMQKLLKKLPEISPDSDYDLAMRTWETVNDFYKPVVVHPEDQSRFIWYFRSICYLRTTDVGLYKRYTINDKKDGIHIQCNSTQALNIKQLQARLKYK